MIVFYFTCVQLNREMNYVDAFQRKRAHESMLEDTKDNYVTESLAACCLPYGCVVN